MAQSSAGVLLYRRSGEGIEVLLVHPGGPFWARRDLGAWSLPKGEIDAGEDPVSTARREFAEETGVELAGELLALGDIRQKGGKRVIGFAAEGDLDATAIRSNTFEMEWPPRSGRKQSFPEIDRAEWFGLDVARQKIIEGQRPLVERLASLLGVS